jgi:hypothetical protein
MNTLKSVDAFSPWSASVLKLASLSAIFTLLSGSTSAEDPLNNPPAIEFGRFPLPVLHTYVKSRSGTSATKAILESPAPDDYPPHTMVSFEDIRQYPAFKDGPRYFAPGRNSIRVYRITQVYLAPYKTIQEDMARLKELLKNRPKDVPFKDYEDTLPDYPPRNARHLFHPKLSYWDVAWGSGLCYLTQFTQEGDDFANDEELTYVFQGISKDGNFYVSADFRITHPKLPSGIDDRPKQHDPDSIADSALLGREPDDAFTPSLRNLREWVGTLKLE